MMMSYFLSGVAEGVEEVVVRLLTNRNASSTCLRTYQNKIVVINNKHIKKLKRNDEEITNRMWIHLKFGRDWKGKSSVDLVYKLLIDLHVVNFHIWKVVM